MYNRLRIYVLALAAIVSLPFAASAATTYSFDLDDCGGIGICAIDPAQADGFQFTVADTVTNFNISLSAPNDATVLAGYTWLDTGFESNDAVATRGTFASRNFGTLQAGLYELSTGFAEPATVGIAGDGVILVSESFFDSITIDPVHVTRITTSMSAVPLPAGIWLLLTGFGGFGWLKRRSLCRRV